MGISIYYEARRPKPLSHDERAKIAELIKKYAVEDRIHVRERLGYGPKWESFFVYPPDSAEDPDVVFEGATGLPANSDRAFEQGTSHWCALLSEIRRVLFDAAWRVTIDDHHVLWNEAASRFEPPLGGIYL
jgi:hypothetical protein